MPSARIDAIFDGQPSFPSRETVLEMFNQVLALSPSESEPSPEIAVALVELIDRHSNVSSSMDQELGERLTAWVKEHWAFDPPAFLKDLCRLLVNSQSQQSLELLRTKRGLALEQGVRRTIDDAIRCHPRSRTSMEDMDADTETHVDAGADVDADIG